MHHFYATRGLEQASARTPDWDFYCCEIERKKAIISVDLNLACAAPNPKLPYYFYISVPILKKTSDGLPFPSELPMLCQVEDHLLDVLLKRVTGVFAGRITCNGYRDFIFYVQNPASARVLAKLALQSYPNLQASIGWKSDEDWDLYNNYLFPNEKELNYIYNNRQISQLQSQGDTLEQERKLRHTLFFPDIETRDQFIVLAIDDRFRIDETAALAQNPKIPHMVKISRYDSVQIDSVNILTAQLIEMATRFSGIYDGWESPLM